MTRSNQRRRDDWPVAVPSTLSCSAFTACRRVGGGLAHPAGGEKRDDGCTRIAKLENSNCAVTYGFAMAIRMMIGKPFLCSAQKSTCRACVTSANVHHDPTPPPPPHFEPCRIVASGAAYCQASNIDDTPHEHNFPHEPASHANAHVFGTPLALISHEETKAGASTKTVPAALSNNAVLLS